MKINIINCFCINKANSGNPAAVVSDFTAGRNEKQKLAKELNMSVTVFLSEMKNDYCNLEFFYPDIEMPLCLHGAIGAAYILLKDMTLKTLVCKTNNGSRILIRNAGSIIEVLVSAHRTPKIIPNSIEICKMLNLKNIAEIENKFPLTTSSIGSPKLLIPLRSFEILATLKPNFDLISKWSIENQINGLYVYTKDFQDNVFDFYARGFNPNTGHNEDAATGVAAAALALSLKKSIIVGQGIFIQRPSEIYISYENPENIWVGGRTVEAG